MPGADAKATRLERTFQHYASSRRKQRAWAADNPGNRAIREELVEHLLTALEPVLEGDGHILDVGCGTGWWLRRLADEGVNPSRLHGLDLLPARVDAACAAVPGAHVTLGDACGLPYDDGSLAAATMITTLSSIDGAKGVQAALLEARRVLTPGGVLLVYEPRVRNPLNRGTRRVRPDDLERAFGEPPARTLLTVLPPLVRAMGEAAISAYPRLSRRSVLLTHSLLCAPR